MQPLMSVHLAKHRVCPHLTLQELLSVPKPRANFLELTTGYMQVCDFRRIR